MSWGKGEAMIPQQEHCFQVEEEVYVEPTAASPGFHSHVVGFKVSQCLILEHPFTESGAHQIRVNDLLWIRCFRSKVLRFKVKVLHILKSPIPLLFLEYPRTVEEINLRESDRKKVFFKGTFLDLRDKKRDRSWEGYILDISDSGCLMWGDFVHLVDRDVLLNFRVPWTGENISAKARVIRCEVTEKGMRSGLKFIDVDDETRKRLQELLKSLEEQGLKNIVSEKQA